MKKTIISAVLFSSLACSAAADTLKFTGANNAWYEVASNWTSETGATAKVPGNGDVANIGMDGVAITAKVGSFANAGTDITGTTINIGENSQLWISSSSTLGSGTVVNFNSANAVKFTGFDYNNTNVTFNMGSEGSILFDMTAGGLEKATLNLGGTLDVLAGGSYTLDQRTLIHFSEINGYSATWDYLAKTTGSFTTAIPGVTLNYVGNSQELTASADTVGNYTLKLVAANGGGYDLVAQYVTGNANIPEPATATLSLLALAGLAARRRRK